MIMFSYLTVILSAKVARPERKKIDLQSVKTISILNVKTGLLFLDHVLLFILLKLDTMQEETLQMLSWISAINV